MTPGGRDAPQDQPGPARPRRVLRGAVPAAALVRLPAPGQDPRQPVPGHGPGGQGRDPHRLQRRNEGEEGPQGHHRADPQGQRGGLGGDREDGREGRRRLGRPVLCRRARRQDGLQDPRALHLRRPHPGPRPRHRRVGRRRPRQACRHRVQVALPHRETGLPVLRRPGPHLGPHPLQGHPELPRRRRLLLRADHPLDQGALPEDHAGPGHHPASLAKTGTTRWYTTVRKFWVEPSPAPPSTARNSTRRNCAAAPCSAAATR